MIRYYCDACGNELMITDRNRVRGERVVDRPEKPVFTRRIGVEVITKIDGVANAGHLCHDCVIDTVMTLDRRVAERLEEPDD